MHVRNLLVLSEVGKVSGGWSCARGAVVGSVKTTRGAIPPVVVSFNRMGWVVALSWHHGVVASSASAATVAVAAVASPVCMGIVLLLLWGCGVGLGGGQGWRRRWHV